MALIDTTAGTRTRLAAASIGASDFQTQSRSTSAPRNQNSEGERNGRSQASSEMLLFLASWAVALTGEVWRSDNKHLDLKRMAI